MTPIRNVVGLTSVSLLVGVAVSPGALALDSSSVNSGRILPTTATIQISAATALQQFLASSESRRVLSEMDALLASPQVREVVVQLPDPGHYLPSSNFTAADVLAASARYLDDVRAKTAASPAMAAAILSISPQVASFSYEYGLWLHQLGTLLEQHIASPNGLSWFTNAFVAITLVFTVGSIDTAEEVGKEPPSFIVNTYDDAVTYFGAAATELVIECVEGGCVGK